VIWNVTGDGDGQIAEGSKILNIEYAGDPGDTDTLVDAGKSYSVGEYYVDFQYQPQGQYPPHQFGFHLEGPLTDMGEYGSPPIPYLNGTVLKSVGEASIEIHNQFLNTVIKLDWSDHTSNGTQLVRTHLVRTSEDGKVEHAGTNASGLCETVSVLSVFSTARARTFAYVLVLL
jgi:hypothetical protein